MRRMFNSTPKPLPPWERYLLRLARGLIASGALIGGSLALGATGYHEFEGLPWLDATLNASMILTGMGPVNTIHTEGGKLFAIFYSLFAGVVFLSAAALLFAPVVRRFLHRFHLDVQDSDDEPPKTQ